LETLFTETSNKQLELFAKYSKQHTNFIKYISSQYQNLALTKKINGWASLEYADFIIELNKAIKKSGRDKLSKSEEMEWMELFEAKKSEAQKLKLEIDKTNNEIDKMVYELYGLKEEEIKIVEGIV
jgi:hypothetical protein